MAQSKPHPSEALEFASITPKPPEHIETARELSKDDSTSSGSPDRGEKHGISSPSEPLSRKTSSLAGFMANARQTKDATDAEHRMTIWQGAKLYPKAIMWSLILSLTIIMEGYDTVLVNSFFALSEFRKTYGDITANGKEYEISTRWQLALNNGSATGSILGLLLAGWVADRIGYKKTMVLALISMSCFIFLVFFAHNIKLLLAGQILCGLSWGVFQTLSTTYASEVMPVALRAYLTSTVNLCWLIGQVIALNIVRALIHRTSEWAYRIPFGLQWAWSVPLLAVVAFAPESPWWLIRRGRTADAKRSLKRLMRKNDAQTIDETIGLMEYTNALEKNMNAGLTYLDCFKNTDLRRTEIACAVWSIQVFVGLPMTSYATYFYIQAGFDTARAFALSCGMYGLGIFGHLMSWGWMQYFGRRPLYLWGCALCFVTMLTAGILGTQRDSPGVLWGLGTLIIIFTFFFNNTVGPICYSLVAEIPSTRLRVKTVVLARVSYNVASLIMNVVTLKMVNPTAWNLKGKACLFWAGTCALCWIWCYFRLPEPKGLTYMELDLLFEKKASARKFRQFQVHLAETGYFSLKESTDHEWHA